MAHQPHALSTNLSNLHLVADAKSRSISPENFSGEKGKGGMATEGPGKSAARDLGDQGWKISPLVKIKPGEEYTLADIEGPGAVQQIWMTVGKPWRNAILRVYYDGQDQPSVECPVGDFFACGWEEFAQVTSLSVCVNPGSAFNCYWTMPFRKRCRVTMENRNPFDPDKPAGPMNMPELVVYYQINYALAEVPEDTAYFHAQFRRNNPLPYKEDHTLLDGVKGRGHFVGCYMAWGVNSSGWWGEGEMKFFLDGDSEFATIVGTGTEDYFCGSYNFENQKTKRYQPYTTPYAGLPQVIEPDGVYKSQQRFGMYRWHITDPIRFEQDLKVTCQALGWMSGGRYHPLQDDIASVAFWYQTLPTAEFPKLGTPDELEVI